MKQRPLSTLIDGLHNPRSLMFLDDKSALLIEAGSGSFMQPDSRLLKLNLLKDESGNLTVASTEVLLDGQRSMNMLQRMHRDEIVGLCHVAQDDEGDIWVSLTDYVDGSRMICVSSDTKPEIPIQGHINSFCFDAKRGSWFGIKSDSNILFELTKSGEERLVATFSDLPEGRDAVPVCIIPEQEGESYLVSLFSGEVKTAEGMSGVGFAKHAGKIVRVWPDNGKIEDVIDGLTLPTAIALTDANTLLALELCDDFLEPIDNEAQFSQPLHGGFQRYSGRLLQIDLTSKAISEIACHLDTPSNLALYDGKILISEGMGVPGRMIPSVQNKGIQDKGVQRKPVALDGRIRFG